DRWGRLRALRPEALPDSSGNGVGGALAARPVLQAGQEVEALRQPIVDRPRHETYYLKSDF
ncbi:hypothetical protein WDZ92_47490, partial [Nostoc sp. NIES-2111]